MITTIPRDFKHTEIDDFIAFIKIAMKASAYVILFTQFQCLSEWMNKLLNAGFDVMRTRLLSHTPQKGNKSVQLENSRSVPLISH